VGDVRQSGDAMYQRLDGFHYFSRNPISTKKNDDMGSDTHHQSTRLWWKGTAATENGLLYFLL